MFNIHIGVPGIATSLIQSIAASADVRRLQSISLISQIEWKDNFRSLVNASEAELVDYAERLTTARSHLQLLSSKEAVVISQHAMLGASIDCFSSSVPLKKAEERLLRLDSVFSEQELTLHLTIASQYDYYRLALHRVEKLRKLDDQIEFPSWAELVKRIRNAAPNRKLVVWDFEQPKKMGSVFAITLMNVSNVEMASKIHVSAKRFVDAADVELERLALPPLSGEIVDYLDMQYESDIEAIRNIDDVSLITPDKVSSRFFHE